jgi:hypothetical protein
MNLLDMLKRFSQMVVFPTGIATVMFLSLGISAQPSLSEGYSSDVASPLTESTLTESESLVREIERGLRVRTFDRPGAESTPSSLTNDHFVYLPLVLYDYPEVTDGIRVSTTGRDVNQCGSVDLPCRSIQYAVNLAQSGDAILVAGGTYVYNASADIFKQLGTTAVVVIVNKELTILGGYNPDNWRMRDPDRYETIIDGRNEYRGVFVLKAASATGLEMKGVTIRNGLGRADPNRSGNDKIFGFGGGMLVEGGALALENVLFQNNTVVGEDTTSEYGGAGSGGGLALRNTTAIVSLRDITFDGNRAEGGWGPERGGLALGGGMYTYQSTVSGDIIRFIDNIAEGGYSSGDGFSGNLHADAQGGGAAFQRGSVITLKNVEVTGNRAMGGDAPSGNPGGAFGGGFFTEDADLALYDGFVFNNTARGGSGVNDGSTSGAGYARGGGIATADGEFEIVRTSVIGNLAQGGDGQTRKGSAAGGGIGSVRFTGDFLTKITNCIIADNQAKLGNGGGSVGGGGGGLWLQGTEAEISHTTFAQNALSSSSMQGQAILIMAYATPTGSQADIYYSVIANHKDGTGAVALHSKSDNSENVANLYRGLWANNSQNTNTDGLFTGLDTMVQARSASFVSPGPPNYDYHIQETSMAKDRANDSTVSNDIDQQSRPSGNGSDIGADECVH